MIKKKLHVLLVDDDAVDRELFIEALSFTAENVEVTEAFNGVHALELLRAGQQKPHLIILDLNMPVMDGREALKAIKNDPELQCIPVCILSTSNAHFDVTTAYAERANLFLVKPMEFSALQEMCSTIATLFQRFVVLTY